MKKIFYVLLVLFLIIIFVKPDIYPVSACENQHPTSLFSDKEASTICIDSKNIYDFNDNDQGPPGRYDINTPIVLSRTYVQEVIIQ